MRIVTFRVFVKRSLYVAVFSERFVSSKRTTTSLHDAREVTVWATPRASRRATFPRFMPLAPPAARLSRACEPLDARDHPSVTRWLSRQNRGSVAADRGSREETCTSQPFAPRGPTGVVTAGLSGVDPAPNGAPREPHRAARLALGKRPRLDHAEAEAEPSGSTSAANAPTFFRSMAHAVSSASETSSGDVSIETEKKKGEAGKTNEARAALDPRDIDEGVAWLRRCHARLVRVVAAVVVARARARVAARGARASARGAEAARREAVSLPETTTDDARAPDCARLRPYAADRASRLSRPFSSFCDDGVDNTAARVTENPAAYRVGGLGSIPRAARGPSVGRVAGSGKKNQNLPERETAAARVARARAERLFVRSSPSSSNPSKRATTTTTTANDDFVTSVGIRPTNRRGVRKNGFFLGGSPLRGAAGAARLREAQSLFRVDRSRVHGFGVFSREAVPRGMPVMEYVGEVVRRPVADRRERAAGGFGARGDLPSTYMFALDENDADSRVVDAARKGNLARFANHSCAPNCATRSVVLANRRRVVLFTLRDVQRGEEVTYDYQFAPEIPERETPCACGAAACRGVINVRA